jgi:hypothetical protein
MVRHRPGMGLAIILKDAVLNWGMVLLAGVMEPDAIFCGFAG